MFQQNIVYFIGAGFSAPFGIPVMGNFIDKARDLYFTDTVKFQELKSTLNLINKYSVVKSIMNINLYNIEDLLSLLAMETYTKERKDSRSLNKLKNFIEIVINYYTPDFEHNELINFVNQLANIKIKKITTQWGFNGDHKVYPRVFDGKKFENIDFGIISLNYDLLLENTLKFIKDNFINKNEIANVNSDVHTHYKFGKEIDTETIPYAKLHGSLDTDIIPPTWDKTSNKIVMKDWILASQLLTNATHLIFLGYSLPQTDNYVKYLLAGSLNKNDRLKRISVITLDNDGSTEERYRNLFGDFRSFNFHNLKLDHFFDFIKKYNAIPEDGSFDFDFFDDNFKEIKDN